MPGEGCKDAMASHLFLPYRIYYDGVFRASVVLAHEGSFSLMFRYVDEFNYYAFQVVTEGNTKEIRLIKMEYGEMVVLEKDEQGGVMMNIWYDISIRFVQRDLEVRWAVHSPGNMPDDKTFGPLDDDMPVALSTSDGFLSSGTIAFGTEGTDQGIAFTRIQMVPLDCSDPNNKEVTIYIPPEASRYKETAQNVFGLVWLVMQADPPMGGAAVWEFAKNYKSKKGAVIQKSLTYGPDHLGTMVTL